MIARSRLNAIKKAVLETRTMQEAGELLTKRGVYSPHGRAWSFNNLSNYTRNQGFKKLGGVLMNQRQVNTYRRLSLSEKKAYAEEIKAIQMDELYGTHAHTQKHGESEKAVATRELTIADVNRKFSKIYADMVGHIKNIAESGMDDRTKDLCLELLKDKTLRAIND